MKYAPAWMALVLAAILVGNTARAQEAEPELVGQIIVLASSCLKGEKTLAIIAIGTRGNAVTYVVASGDDESLRALKGRVMDQKNKGVPVAFIDLTPECNKPEFQAQIQEDRVKI